MKEQASCRNCSYCEFLARYDIADWHECVNEDSDLYGEGVTENREVACNEYKWRGAD